MTKGLERLFDCGWEAYAADSEVTRIYTEMKTLADRYYQITGIKGSKREEVMEAFSMKKDLLRLSKELAYAVKQAELNQANNNENTRAASLFRLARESEVQGLEFHVEASNNARRAKKTLMWARGSIAASIFIALFTMGSQFASTPRRVEYVQLVKQNDKAMLEHKSKVEKVEKENLELKKKIISLEKAVKNLKVVRTTAYRKTQKTIKLRTDLAQPEIKMEEAKLEISPEKIPAAKEFREKGSKA